MEISKREKYFPIKIVLFFLVFSELFVFLGPIDFNIQYSLILISFLLIVNLSLWKGYKSGILHYQKRGKFCMDSIRAVHLTKMILILSLCMIIPRIYVGWNLSSVGEIVSKFQTALAAPDDVYRDFLEDKSTSPLKYLVSRPLKIFLFTVIQLFNQ